MAIAPGEGITQAQANAATRAAQLEAIAPWPFAEHTSAAESQPTHSLHVCSAALTLLL